MKRYLSLLAFLLAWVGAWAYDLKIDGICYDVVGANEVAVTAGDSPYSDYVDIPATVVSGGTTYHVTAIADRAFNACRLLSGVSLPGSISRIGASAFSACSSLSLISLPDGLKSIGSAAFYGCERIEQLSIPAVLDTIGYEAFSRCTALSRIDVDSRNTRYSSQDGVLMNKAATRLIAYPNERGASYEVPVTVTVIDSQAFAHCDRLRSVVIPATVRVIGDAAFYGCLSLAELSLPEGVSEVGLWAFSECRQLQSVKLPSTLKSIGEGAFSFCDALQSITVDGANTRYSSLDGVLLNKQQTTLLACPGGKSGSYSIPLTVTAIGEQAFYGCQWLREVTLPAQLSDLGQNPFVFCENLKDVKVDNNNNGYAATDGVLFNKDKTSLVYYPNGRSGSYVVPGSVTSMSCGPFLGSAGLTSISIPQSVTSLGSWTFLGCYGLRSVSLPHTLASMGEQVFAGCNVLDEIIVSGRPQAATDFDTHHYQTTTLYVPAGTTGDFLAMGGWSGFSDIREFGLYAQSQSVSRGQWLRVPVLLAHALPMTALEMGLHVPEGVTLEQIELTEANAQSHQLSWRATSGGGYSVSIHSVANQPLAACDTVFYVTLATSGDYPTGVYNVDFRNITIDYATALHQGEAAQRDVVAGISIDIYLGDVNRNGRLNVADVVETIRYVEDRPTEHFHFDEADVTANGSVTLADAVRTVQLIHDCLPFDVWGEPWQPDEAGSQHLVASGLTIEQDAEALLRLELSSPVACQFELSLADGLAVATGSSLMPPTVSSRELDGNRYSIVATTLSSEPLGSELLIPLRATADAELGDCEATLGNIVFADGEAAELRLADTSFTIRVEANTGINDVTADAQPIRFPADVYTLQGMKIRQAAMSLKGLPAGVYIVGGRTVIVR